MSATAFHLSPSLPDNPGISPEPGLSPAEQSTMDVLAEVHARVTGEREGFEPLPLRDATGLILSDAMAADRYARLGQFEAAAKHLAEVATNALIALGEIRARYGQ